MSVPSYAGSMISNYREAYKQLYKESFVGTDEQIWGICNTVFDDSSIEKQDFYRVEAMRDITHPITDE